MSTEVFYEIWTWLQTDLNIPKMIVFVSKHDSIILLIHICICIVVKKLRILRI